MRRLREAVVAAVRTHQLWQPHQQVRVAVSGGLDSMVLLDVLVQTQRLHLGQLSVHTVDHGTRPDSASDAAFVRDYATQLGLPVRVSRAALGEGASEAQCRQARRQALGADLADDERIAMAHHARDHAETLLIRAMRGTGPRGLGNMRPAVGVWVRPLLAVSHGDIARYAERAQVPWREDSSNSSSRFLRNRVRNEVLPLLEELRGGSVAALARTARLVAEESAWIDTLVDAWPGSEECSCSFLTQAPVPIVRRAVLRREPTLGHRHIDAIRDLASRGRGQIALPGGRVAIAHSGRVFIYSSDLTFTPSKPGGACDT